MYVNHSALCAQTRSTAVHVLWVIAAVVIMTNVSDSKASFVAHAYRSHAHHMHITCTSQTRSTTVHVLWVIAAVVIMTIVSDSVSPFTSKERTGEQASMEISSSQFGAEGGRVADMLHLKEVLNVLLP